VCNFWTLGGLKCKVLGYLLLGCSFHRCKSESIRVVFSRFVLSVSSSFQLMLLD